ncbi:MAG: ATP-binding protein [Deltaproteobacteria bacterium]|nr:ATP-binding protein [Deltaproteobacteria bacterium]
MIRFAATGLDRWFKSPNRKPLILRGARQVGKTWLVRDFAQRHRLALVELNFEKLPNLAELFSVNDPREIVGNLEAEFSISITPETSCLFLDEIQAVPELLAKLRWFKEELPQLAVIAAGSLLEFALDRQQYSMPVGRISYFHLEQLSFFEFVLACGHEALHRKMISCDPAKGLPQTLHDKCLDLYKQFCLIGGMPEVVQAWVNSGELSECLKIQHDLLATYRDDFHKYGGEIDARLLNRILHSVAEQLGGKFVFSRADSGARLEVVKKSLTMLCQARVCTKVVHTSANGLPLGAESNEKFFKALLIDIGLVSAQLGLASVKRSELDHVLFANKGGLAEQFVGQQFRAAQSPLMEPQLFYWQRTGGRLGEIDYIIQHGNQIVPVEVKSGAAGSMKSLHQFMAEKGLSLAIRFDTNPPSLQTIQVKTTTGKSVKYRLLSLPLYLAEHLATMMAVASTS